MLSPLSDVLRGAMDLVFAPVCVGCSGAIHPHAPDRLVCFSCWSRCRPLPQPLCERCWTPLPVEVGVVAPSCRECPQLRPAVRFVRAAYLLEGPSRALVHALKYRGWHSLAAPMAARMGRVPFPDEVREEVEVVVPVPLSPVRLRQRGYNQAALLASDLCRLQGWRFVPELLVRGRSAGSQTTLHPAERRANVAGAFRVAPAAQERLAGKHALLIDDVWTTGATALACANALLEAGARAVSICTFARALPELERTAQRAERARDRKTQ